MPVETKTLWICERHGYLPARFVLDRKCTCPAGESFGLGLCGKPVEPVSAVLGLPDVPPADSDGDRYAFAYGLVGAERGSVSGPDGRITPDQAEMVAACYLAAARDARESAARLAREGQEGTTDAG